MPNIIRTGGGTVAPVDTKTYLYNAGDECNALTGGWNLQCWFPQSTSSTIKNAGNVETNVVVTGTNQAVQSIYSIANSIDLTNFTKLGMQVEMTVATNYGGSLAARTIIDVFDNTTVVESQNYPTSIAATTKTITSGSYNGNVELDVTSLNGSHRIDFQTWYTSIIGNTKIIKVWLE